MRPSKMSLQRKLTLTHLSVTLVAVLIVEAVALLITDELAWGWTAGLAAVSLLLAGLVGLLLGGWASRHLAVRLQRVLQISQDWLGGDLSPRIADPVADDLGQLAGQLDLLAEHLAQDERDLDRLRQRDRQTHESYHDIRQHLFSLSMTASALRARFDALPDPPAELGDMVRQVETAAQAAQRETSRLIKDL